MVIEGFSDRLKVLIGNQSANAFARDVDIGESLVRKYLAGATPGIDKVAQIAKIKGVALDWLINGEGSMLSEEYSNPPMRLNASELEANAAFTLVPRLDIEASAGPGALAHNEQAIDYLAFQESWLRARKINPSFARVLTAKGDSMEPTIRNGDVLLVDTSINYIQDNTIYVIVYGDILLVKRVHSRFNGTLQLISDNPLYPPEEITAGEIEQLHVAGRVMWFGRSI